MKGFENDIQQCIATLTNGGLILYPTDTIWGIGCDATDPITVEKIYQLKKRSDEKSMLILVADESDISKYIAEPQSEIFEYLRKASKPTTVIYKRAKNLAKNLIGKDESIAIRICKDEFCKRLVRAFDKPIVSTSANVSGQPAAKTFREIGHEIKAGVDYIVQYRQDDMNPSRPSTVIRWENNRAIIVRE